MRLAWSWWVGQKHTDMPHLSEPLGDFFHFFGEDRTGNLGYDTLVSKHGKECQCQLAVP